MNDLNIIGRQFKFSVIGWINLSWAISNVVLVLILVVALQSREPDQVFGEGGGESSVMAGLPVEPNFSTGEPDVSIPRGAFLDPAPHPDVIGVPGDEKIAVEWRLAKAVLTGAGATEDLNLTDDICEMLGISDSDRVQIESELGALIHELKEHEESSAQYVESGDGMVIKVRIQEAESVNLIQKSEELVGANLGGVEKKLFSDLNREVFHNIFGAVERTIRIERTDDGYYLTERRWNPLTGRGGRIGSELTADSAAGELGRFDHVLPAEYLAKIFRTNEGS